MNDTTMMARLAAEAAGQGADLVTLRALIEEASQAGAARALAALGLAVKLGLTGLVSQ